MSIIFLRRKVTKLSLTVSVCVSADEAGGGRRDVGLCLCASGTGLLCVHESGIVCLLKPESIATLPPFGPIEGHKCMVLPDFFSQ